MNKLRFIVNIIIITFIIWVGSQLPKWLAPEIDFDSSNYYFFGFITGWAIGELIRFGREKGIFQK